METLRTIASVLGTLSVIITFTMLVIKPFRTWICNKFESKLKENKDEEKEKVTIDLILEEIQALSEAFKKLTDEKETERDALRCILRHSITLIYETHKKYKCFPEYIKKDMVYMCEAYTKLNGNSYIETIYEEMLKWETDIKNSKGYVK